MPVRLRAEIESILTRCVNLGQIFTAITGQNL